ncbi:chemotaxis protein CheD [bacterium]|nr:MAG: chemotaxis protein CheD [bacterium]
MRIDDRNQISVGLGRIELTKPPGVLVSIGIGSCIALCLYHPITKTAGMAHIMLPEESEKLVSPDKPAKYAELGVKNILKKFAERGIKNPRSLVAKIVGGAQLFIFKQVPNVGERNIRAVKKILNEYNIPIVGESVGGDFGRSVWFFAETGKVLIRSKFRNIIEI